MSGPVAVSTGERIRGQATQRYQLAVDVERARGLVPTDWLDAFEDNIAEMRVTGIPRTFDAEAWIGEDGLVLRVEFSFVLGRAAGGGTMKTVYDFSDFGAPMELDIPDDGDVVALEDVTPR